MKKLYAVLCGLVVGSAVTAPAWAAVTDDGDSHQCAATYSSCTSYNCFYATDIYAWVICCCEVTQNQWVECEVQVRLYEGQGGLCTNKWCWQIVSGPNNLSTSCTPGPQGGPIFEIAEPTCACES